MKKNLIALAFLCYVLTAYTACGGCSRNMATIKGYDEVVVDGVVYIQFPSGVSVKYNTDGTVCKKK